MHYNYQKGEFWHTTPEGANKFLWKQVLMGDSTDNIKGLPVLGKRHLITGLRIERKTSRALLKQYVEKFGMGGDSWSHKTFRLVYLLKTDEDVWRETELELPPLNVKQLNPDSDGDLW